jgi:hypothetical protein
MKYLLTLLALSTILLFQACDNNSSDPNRDNTPPFMPVGITTISLNNSVEIQWIENQESDIDGYNIYVSNSFRGHYSLIGTTRKASYVDAGAVNGRTYYYAVTAFDLSGNESELSRDVVYDTPRPEGLSVALTDRFQAPVRAGYDFSEYSILNYDTNFTDFYFETTTTGVPYLVVWKDSDIQDMGYTKTLDDISAAPEAGWAPKDAAAIAGHTYVIRTFDNHFAKVRVISISQSTLVFDWAYQTAAGNPELFRADRSGLSKRIRTR